MVSATVRAHPNIAFIKYWGNQDDSLKIPVNGSLSMNLEGLYTETTVTWDDSLTSDVLFLNNEVASGEALQRVSRQLGYIRQRLSINSFAQVISYNNFPMGVGIASSASSFAALTVAAVEATGHSINEKELTTIARLGSGSASRSIPAGFVEWFQGESHESSYATSIAHQTHWKLTDVIAVVSDAHKRVGSESGHKTAQTSDLQKARVIGAPKRLDNCRQSILSRDFDAFASVVEEDSNLMHAVMMTSKPALFYWLPETLRVMERIRELRRDGIKVCYTLDAGPNVHCLCEESYAPQVQDALSLLNGVNSIRVANVGGGAEIINRV